MADTPTLPIGWLKFQTLCVVIASLAVPVVIAMIGNTYTDAQKSSEVSVRYVELATSILKTPPTESNKALRTWAVEVLDATSPVKLTSQVKLELSKDGIQERVLTDREKIMQILCDMGLANDSRAGGQSVDCEKLPKRKKQ